MRYALNRGDNMYENMKKNFKERKIDVKVFDTIEDVYKYLCSEIAAVSSVGVRSSSHHAELCRYIENEHTNVRLEVSDDDRPSEWQLNHYIARVNAVSVDGSIINADERGNKIQALTFGPENVHVIVSEDAIFQTEIEAIRHSIRVAPSPQLQELGIQAPCLQDEQCHHCSPLTSGCTYVAVNRGQFFTKRLEILCIRS